MSASLLDMRELRNDPEYINFLKVWRALHVITSALRHYAETKAKELQDVLLKQKMPLCKCKYTLGMKPCRHHCQWAKELEKYHLNKKKRYVSFHQSNSKLWHDRVNGYWEIAKVFMQDLGIKWNDVKDPASTDPTGILNFLIFCNHVKVQKDVVKEVRDLRNDLAHTKTCKLNVSRTTAAFDSIDNLLNIVELLSCKEVQDCRVDIIELRSASEKIVSDHELQVLSELKDLTKERKEKEKQKKLLNFIEILMSSQRNNSHPSSYVDLKEDLKYIFGKLFLILLYPASILKDCSRWKRFLLFILTTLLMASVSDDSVFVPDYGCSPSRGFSTTVSFGLQEFDFTTHLSHKREDFFGRSWFFQELGAIFNETNAPVGVLITGDPGSGKSALMSQLICSPHSNFAIYDNIIAYHVCDYSEKGKRNGARFVRNLAHQIASNIPEYADLIRKSSRLVTELDKNCNADAVSCFFTAIIHPLKLLQQTTISYKYVVIDALDECVDDKDTSPVLDILHYKIQYFPKWLKVILTSRNGSTVTSKIPRTLQRIFLNPQDENNIEDIRSYISRYLRKKSSFMGLVSQVFYGYSTETITEELTKRAEGNFLFTKTVLENNLEENGAIDFDLLPNRLHDIYDELIRRYFYKDNFKPCRILFEVLLASGPIAKKELFGVLKLQNIDIDEIRLVVERVSCLLRFGLDFASTADERVSIYHQSFAEWLANNPNRVGGFSVNKNHGHEYIADFLVNHLGTRKENITFDELKRLCMHMVQSGGLNHRQREYLVNLNVTKIYNEKNGKFVLHILAEMENAAPLLTFLLSNITDVDVLDNEGKTPAFFAASKGLTENILSFLKKGSCVNCIFKQPSTYGKMDLILQMKGYDQLSAIHTAAFKGHVNVIEVILTHNPASLNNVDVNLPTIFHIAAERGHLELVKMLHENDFKADIISLHHAVARNHYDVVEYLLKTVGLRDECLMCHENTMSKLPFTKSFYDLHYMFCETSLHAAVSKRYHNLTKLLLNYGNNTTECKHYSGKTPLMDAVERNDTIMTELLLRNGANVEEKCGQELRFRPVNQTNDRYFFGKKFLYTLYREKTSCACGNKVLHLCAKYGLWHLAKYLINTWNASMLDKNCKGESVWKIAKISHNEDFIYHVNRMLLNLDEKIVSTTLGLGSNQRKTFEKLLKKFFMKSRPYQSSFQCDSTFEGMSPLHIAALMGNDMLNRVYTKAHEIAPSLPLNCTNKHWITPTYLAHLYDSIHSLTDESQSKQTLSENSLLQYPDREAEFHIIFNYFFKSPSPEQNVNALRTFPRFTTWNFDVRNCTGFYDLVPERKDLQVKSYCPPIELDDTEDYDASRKSVQKFKKCGREYYFYICVSDFEYRMMMEQHAYDCFCPSFISRLHDWFSQFTKHDRQINPFIVERMGWKVSGNTGEIEKRWPVYFLYKKLMNEYSEYKYLDALNEGFKIENEREEY